MKHHFPTNSDIYCNEKHTLEQAEEFVLAAKLVGLEIREDTLEELMSKSYPYFMWDGSENIITQHGGDGDFDEEYSGYRIVSFEEFKEFLGPIPNTRLEIERLFSTV